MKNSHRSAINVTVSIGLMLGTVASAQDINPHEDRVPAPKKDYSPYVGDHFPNRVYFGDTHLHSSWSTDSGMASRTTNSSSFRR